MIGRIEGERGQRRRVGGVRERALAGIAGPALALGRCRRASGGHDRLRPPVGLSRRCVWGWGGRVLRTYTSRDIPALGIRLGRVNVRVLRRIAHPAQHLKVAALVATAGGTRDDVVDGENLCAVWLAHPARTQVAVDRAMLGQDARGEPSPAVAVTASRSRAAELVTGAFVVTLADRATRRVEVKSSAVKARAKARHSAPPRLRILRPRRRDAKARKPRAPTASGVELYGQAEAAADLGCPVDNWQSTRLPGRSGSVHRRCSTDSAVQNPSDLMWTERRLVDQVLEALTVKETETADRADCDTSSAEGEH
ncbi:hypothetical protein Caci_6921 [Catenulispora acidiphila DSM 44928]|uniref:Uncharacterized protein n=1 Tax=Catenulispora acidiphila (strain DSM 44928 / JCM 14897 / NBRC 102108 / NRRL B-24433 / ID139908) TaxID=479433 RepID=C7Q3J0_CATAD|nr:hypothetical protein Caci_6921 [Catenulispora acidiphila DSM 44928]